MRRPASFSPDAARHPDPRARPAPARAGWRWPSPRALNGEIISADSVQVYRGFDIGSDKLSPEARRGIPHHLIDIIPDCEQFNASRFLDLSFAAAAGIWSRGRVPVVCGGTALYLRVMMRGHLPGEQGRRPARGAEAGGRRPRLGRPVRRARGHRSRLCRARSAPNDHLRLVRALEIYRNSGLPPSEAFRLSRSPFAGRRFIRVGLQVEREKLYRAIDARVERMLAAGLVDEVKGLLQAAPGLVPALPLAGLQGDPAHLRGETDLATATELIQRHSRQFAKRQLTWFRQEKDIRWFPAEDQEAIIGSIRQCL